MTQGARSVVAASLVFALLPSCASPVLGRGAYELGPGSGTTFHEGENVQVEIEFVGLSGDGVLASVHAPGDEEPEAGVDIRADGVRAFTLAADEVLYVVNRGPSAVGLRWTLRRPE